MNIQEIIVLVIVVVAIFFAIRKLLKKAQNPSDCGGCSASSCGGCEIADLKKDTLSKTTNTSFRNIENKSLN